MEEDQREHGATVIRTGDQRVRVFVISTLQRLAEERPKGYTVLAPGPTTPQEDAMYPDWTTAAIGLF